MQEANKIMQEANTTTQTIEYLYRNRHATRVGLHKYLHVTPAAVSKLIKQLIDDHIVIETGQQISQKEGAGRSKKIISLSKQIGNYIGVSFNMAGLALVLTTIYGEIINKIFINYNEMKKYDLNQLIINNLKLIISQNPNAKPLGVGFAIPGHYDAKQYKLVSNNQMWQNFDLETIQEQINLPMLAENNVESMADAHYLFSNDLSKKGNFIFFHIGYGIYSAFIEPGNLHPKRNYSVGEVGHTIIDPNGFKCECGKKGCLQTYSSHTWLLKRARAFYDLSENTVLHQLVSDKSKITFDTLLAAYKLNDPYTADMLDTSIKYLGIIISNLLMVYDADVIYLNGFIVQIPEFKDKLLKFISGQLKFINSQKQTKIEVLSKDKYRGAIGGCALVALSQVIKNPNYQEITLK